MPLPQRHDGAKSFNKKQVHSMLAGQLSDLRRAYTDWNQKNRNLMGSVLIKLQINASGDVIEAQEQTSRLTDLAFGSVVLSEARKWKFPKFNDEFSEVVVPLVFVPQGMDPQTIVRWEKALTSSDLDPNAVSPLHITGSPSGDGERELSVASDRPPADLRNPQAVVASASKIQAAEEPPKNLLEYKTRRAAPLREEPRFAAASAENISPGTRVSVLEAKGDWFKVKSRLSGKIGYVRKEYITPASAVQ